MVIAWVSVVQVHSWCFASQSTGEGQLKQNPYNFTGTSCKGLRWKPEAGAGTGELPLCFYQVVWEKQVKEHGIVC